MRPSSALRLAAAALLLGASCGTPNFERSEMRDEALAQWEYTARSPRTVTPQEALPAAPEGPTPGTEPAPAPFPTVFTDAQPHALQLRSAELGQALRLLAETGGVNLVLMGDFHQVVELDLPEVPLQVALELLCGAYDCRVEARDGLVVVSREDPNRADTRVFELQSISAAAVQPELQVLVGDTGLVVNPARNVVMVTAPEPRLREVATYLASVDRPERQVLIEARILEVARKELEELGTRIAYHDISVGDDTATFVSSLLTGSDQVLGTFTSANGNFDAAINALQSLVGLDILSRPRLIALNNREARLDIVTEIPYVNATTTTQGSTTSVGTQTIQEIEYKLVGLKLALTPTILEGGLISLTVDQEVSEQTGSFLDVPIVDSRHIQTGFTVKEGQTILIGGILKKAQLDSRDGIPILADLPLIGQAFRNDVRNGQETELILLMTPWLVDPRDGRAVGASTAPVTARVDR